MKPPAHLFCLLTVGVLSLGCGANPLGGTNPLIRWMDKQSVELERMAELFNGIQNPADADAKLEEIRQCYGRMTALKQESAALFRKHAQDKVRKSTAAAAASRIKSAERAFEKAATRVGERRDLSVPFCSMLRVESVEYLVATAVAMREVRKIPGAPGFNVPLDLGFLEKTLALYQQHGADQVVEVVIAGGDSRALEQLVDAAGGDPASLASGDQSVALIAPIADFAGYCDRVASRGGVTAVDPSRRSFEFRLDGGASVAATHDGTSSDAQSRARRNERDAEIRERLSNLKRGDFAGFDDHFAADPAVDERPTRGRSLAGGGPWADEEQDPAEATLQPAWPTASQDAPPPSVTPAAKSLSLTNLSPRDQKHLELAEALTNGDRIAMRTAAAALLEVPPTAIKNKEIRRMVARGYRALLKDANYMMTDGETAILGLELYAGEHSVPLVIEYLDTEPLRVPDAAVETLRKHRSPEGITALIKLLGTASARDAAVGALREVGPDAEEPLLAVALKLDPAAAAQAIELLGEVGTPRSYRVLKYAAKSPLPAVRSAARESLRLIQQRD